MELVIESNGLNDTSKLGQILGEEAFKGALYSLDGDLGAGKTTLTKSIALALNIKDNVSSPTFNILKCYFDGRLPLYHIDAYRLEDGTNASIGLEEVIEGDGLCIVEWGKFIQEMIFEPLEIKITILDDNKRKFIIKNEYKKYDHLMNRLKEEFKC
jgi:tRNA threonylcarbamoyladenosine biosynthesis protein TsaE